MSGEATVEHRLLEGIIVSIVGPGLWVAAVAPGIEAHLLFCDAVCVGDRHPGAEVVRLSRGALQCDACQAVLAVVCEGLFQVI